MQTQQPRRLRVDRQRGGLSENDQRDGETAAGERGVDEERSERGQPDPGSAGGEQFRVAAAKKFPGEEGKADGQRRAAEKKPFEKLSRRRAETDASGDYALDSYAATMNAGSSR